MERKINILFINPCSGNFGSETSLLRIIDQLGASYQSFVLLNEEGPLVEKLKTRDISTFIFDYMTSDILNIFRLTGRSLAIIKKNKIDVIHFNQHIKAINFWPIFFLTRKPIVFHVRGNVSLSVVIKVMMTWRGHVIFVSRAIRDCFLNNKSFFAFFINKKNVEVLYNGIDLSKFEKKKSEFRKEIEIKENVKFIGQLGAIDYIKRQDLFIKAAALVCKKRSDVKFIIVGDLYFFYRNNIWQEHIRYKQMLIDLINELRLEDKISMIGFREDIPDILNALDILVQPSLHEALGTCLIEAMACRKAVIGTRTEGIPEVIGCEGAGIVVDKHTPEALAKAIFYYLDHPDEIVRAGEIGRKRAEVFFDEKKNMFLLKNLYTKLARR